MGWLKKERVAALLFFFYCGLWAGGSSAAHQLHFSNHSNCFRFVLFGLISFLEEKEELLLLKGRNKWIVELISEMNEWWKWEFDGVCWDENL